MGHLSALNTRACIILIVILLIFSILVPSAHVEAPTHLIPQQESQWAWELGIIFLYGKGVRLVKI